jgi:hypothetical protein
LSAPGFLALARKGLKIKLYGRADGPVKQEEEEEAKAVVAMHGMRESNSQRPELRRKKLSELISPSPSLPRHFNRQLNLPGQFGRINRFSLLDFISSGQSGSASTKLKRDLLPRVPFVSNSELTANYRKTVLRKISVQTLRAIVLGRFGVFQRVRSRLYSPFWASQTRSRLPFHIEESGSARIRQQLLTKFKGL